MGDNLAFIVLAAGKGKRMKSPLPKVLHRVGDRSLIERTIYNLKNINHTQLITVVSPVNKNEIKAVLKENTNYSIQQQALGTAHAVAGAVKKIRKNVSSIGVLYGDDTAFYKSKTLEKVYKKHLSTKAKITFITVLKDEPSGFGRIIRKDGRLREIVEEKDATPAQLAIHEVNDGVYFFDRKWLEECIAKLKPSKFTGELYLTDLIAFALNNGEKVETFKLKDEHQWHGVNNMLELAIANLKISRNVHFMGISGAGAAAVAGIAQAYGYNVSGCDLNPNSPYAKNLRINIKSSHQKEHLKDIAVLVVSPAVLIYDEQNLEIKTAKQLGIPIVTWQEFQGAILQKDKFIIAIAGAYGKSTTTAMVSKILIDAGLDPTCEVGANVDEWGSNFRIGKSKFYVCEADEYFNNFLNYKPDIAVILNIVWEHPDFFESEKVVFDVYFKFAKNIKEKGILITSPKNVKRLSTHTKNSVKTLKAEDFKVGDLKVIGSFRKENANFALTIAKVLNLDLKKAVKSVESFTGLERRLEYKGHIGGIKFFDDYAVQPYTIKATANALREKFKNSKILLVFEPHTFSRISKFEKEFIKSLKEINIDRIFITDVFAAREKQGKDNLSEKIALKVGPKAIYTGSINETARLIGSQKNDFEVICTMGAGDVYKIYDEVKNG